MNTYRKPSVNQSGFTLIEMLVVIAIIALLITMISAATGKALEKSRRTACASNLHGLAQGLLVYAMDHNGYFPKYRPDSNAWPWAGEWATEDYSTFYENYIGDKRTYYCPSDLRIRPLSEGGRGAPYFPEKNPGDWRRNTSYNYFGGMSAWNNEARDHTGNKRGGYQNLSDIPNASSSTLIADIMMLGKSIPSDFSASPEKEWNHPGKTIASSGGNLGYADGHVAWVTVGNEPPDEYINRSKSRYYINQQPSE
ncbi:type II secretion system protein [Kiritimatiellaeota bacterium B1221]|nr:type II secretion system protein [Kiritimatiellaeota bacterium B1221]